MISKKGMELSISTIVVMILSIIIVSAGIYMISSFLGETEDIQKTLDRQTKSQIEYLLSQGARVAVPFNSQTIRRGDANIFGVGILNIEERKNFKIEVTFSEGFDEAKKRIDTDASDWVRYSKAEITIDKNQRHMESIYLTVPGDAEQGQYIFSVRVRKMEGGAGGTPYDTVKKIYVTVP